MTIREAVDAALGDLTGWQVVLAQSLADGLDESPNASMARELRAVMHEIAATAEAKVEGPADELRRRRALRIAEVAESPVLEDFGGA